MSTQLLELRYLVVNYNLFYQEYPTANEVFAHDENYSIVQRLLVTVYHILCNTVYFIIKQAYGSWVKKRNLKGVMYPLHFIAIFSKFLGTF